MGETTNTPRRTALDFGRISLKTAANRRVALKAPPIAAVAALERPIHELARADAAALAASKPLLRMVEADTGSRLVFVPHGCITDAVVGCALELVLSCVRAGLGGISAPGWCRLTGDVNSAVARLVLSQLKCRRLQGKRFSVPGSNGVVA